MTSSTVAKLATVSTANQPRPEALESWAEGRMQPGARVRLVEGDARAEATAFATAEGRAYAGTHLLIDLWGAERLDDLAHCERTLREAVAAVGATLLHIHLHHFTPNDGVSGVAVLAESHISIHTWPELGFAALDVFVCGDCDAEAAVPVFERAWSPKEVRVTGHRRGLVE